MAVVWFLEVEVDMDLVQKQDNTLCSWVIQMGKRMVVHISIVGQRVHL